MIPKKKRGFRKIVVDHKIYYWRFSNIIEIRPEQKKSNKLEVSFGYFDEWLYVNDKDNKPEDFEHKVITPNFIREIIECAIELDWNIEAENCLKKLKYEKGKFEIVGE